MAYRRRTAHGDGQRGGSPERRGYANGYKPKTLDTPAGTVTVQVPKTRDADEPFYTNAYGNFLGEDTVLLTVTKTF